MKDALTMLRDSLIAHDIPVLTHVDSISVDEGRLELAAEVFEKDSTASGARLVLEVRALSPLLNGQPIVECFAGSGDTKERALSEAFGKFLLGSFHVLIEGLIDHTCAEMQAEIENWSHKNGDWKVFSGPLITQYSNASTLSGDYPEFFSKLTTLFCETVPFGPHWVRVFLGSFEGKVIGSEVLLDNEPWDDAHRLLVSREWTCQDEYQSLRHFVITLPVVGKGDASKGKSLPGGLFQRFFRERRGLFSRSK